MSKKIVFYLSVLLIFAFAFMLTKEVMIGLKTSQYCWSFIGLYLVGLLISIRTTVVLGKKINSNLEN